MITIRKSHERGSTRLDWLDSKHTFSFGDYYDSAQTHFRALRVINDDRIAPASGFGMHGHRDMEIVTYIVSGSLQHRDSLGSGAVMIRGDVQRMSAGAGIRHSEFNPSPAEPVHLLQIWLTPERNGLKPEYAQQRFPDEGKRNRLQLLASHDGREGSLLIHQNVDLYAALLVKGASIERRFGPGRHGWIQIVSGTIAVQGRELGAGDGAAVSDEERIKLTANDDAELLLFDLS